MQAITEETVILAKTRELCQTITEQPEFRTIRVSLDTFMADDKAKNQYQLVVEKGDALQQKQQFGPPPDTSEITEFERNREILLNNPVARDFLDAQQQMHQIQESVMQYVSKTFELGRVPALEDFSSGDCGSSGCGSGCDCAH